MTTAFVRTRIATAVAGLALALGAGYAQGAGFILQENSGSGLGNAYAGGAAASEDADTVWTNPAGMSRLKTNQIAAAVNGIFPSMKFSNDGGSKNASPLQPLGGDGGNAGVSAAVPNLYLVVPIDPQWAFGVGVNAPFGLTTEYDNNWIGRYQAIKSKIETINVNPAISYKFGNWAVGAGANYQRIKADFTQATNYSGQLAAAAKGMVAAGAMPASQLLPFVGATAGLDGLGDVSGDDDSWGWNVGGEWGVSDPTFRTRIGLSYRSAIKYHIAGNVNFSTPSAPTLPPSLAPYYAVAAGLVAADPRVQNGGITSDIKLPDFANLSFFHTMLNDKWDFMADVQWTNWSTIQDLTFVRTNGTVLSSTPEHWKDAWRISGGVNYRYTDKWTFRGGVAWDQSPVPDQYRTARLPDNDRWWLATGVQYKWDQALKFDVGAAYLIIRDSSIAQISPAQAVVDQVGYLSGNYNNYTWVVSGQVTWSF
jgi:long-chain fatty acid transport protein